jgi:hypothetical protein
MIYTALNILVELWLSQLLSPLFSLKHQHDDASEGRHHNKCDSKPGVLDPNAICKRNSRITLAEFLFDGYEWDTYA